MVCVDLNSDLGESFGAYRIGNDAEVISTVTSVNVACGFHAGDPCVMRATVCAAAVAGVAVGAHPGYPDLVGFGRRDMGLSVEEIHDAVLYQIGALAGFCRAAGVDLHHVKPHGQLYNRSTRDRGAARAIARAVAEFDGDLVLVGMAGGALVEEGRALGLRCAEEFFADRAYAPDGALVARTQPGAVLDDAQEAVGRTLRAVREGVVRSAAGTDVAVGCDTVCVHGDSAHALEFARGLRRALEQAGVTVRSV